MNLVDYIGIVAALMGVCAIFVTVTPMVNNLFQRKMKNKIAELETKIKQQDIVVKSLEAGLLDMLERVNQTSKKTNNE